MHICIAASLITISLATLRVTPNMELFIIIALALLTPSANFQVVSSSGYVLGFGLGVSALLGLVLIGFMSLPGVVFILVWVSILVILAMWVLLGYVLCHCR